MNWVYWYLLPLGIYLLAIAAEQKRKHFAVYYGNRRKKEVTSMRELAKRFLHKRCYIYTISNALDGVIQEIGESGMMVDVNGRQEIVNLEYVTRIQERPVKKNKKS